MSVHCVVENLLHAAGLQKLEGIAWTLPALHIAIESLVEEIGRQFPGNNVQSLISYAPDPWVEENFGSYPPLNCPEAESAGFNHDGNLAALITNALNA